MGNEIKADKEAIKLRNSLVKDADAYFAAGNFKSAVKKYVSAAAFGGFGQQNDEYLCHQLDECYRQNAVTFDDLLQLAANNFPALHPMLFCHDMTGVVQTLPQLQRLLGTISPNLFLKTLNFSPNIIKLFTTFESVLEFVKNHYNFSSSLFNDPKICALVTTNEQLQRLAVYNLVVAQRIENEGRLHLAVDRQKYQLPAKHTLLRFFPSSGLPQNRALDFPLSAKEHRAYQDKGKVRNEAKEEMKLSPEKHNENFFGHQENVDEYIFSNHLSINEYFYAMNFGKSGFYEKMEFNRDYETEASKGEGLHTALAFQFFSCWQKLNKLAQYDPKLKQRKYFNILECGGGNGRLCEIVLTIIDAMAEKHPTSDWPKFKDEFRYKIVELSPALIKLQKERTAKFGDRVNVIPGDARNLSKLKQHFPEGISVAVSNELLDMLPPHEIMLDHNNKIMIGHVIATIDEKYLNKYLEEKRIDNDYVLKLKAKSVVHKTILYPKHEFSGIVLSKEDFLKIHAIYAEEKFTSDSIYEPFSFHKVYLDQQFYPEVTAFINDHPEFLKQMSPGNIRYLNLGIKQYFSGVRSLLQPGGEFINGDYGDIDHIVRDYRLRTFSRLGLQNQEFPFLTPGHRDITTDVNFSVAASIGEQLGLKTKGFGQQGLLLPSANDKNSTLNAIKMDPTQLNTFCTDRYNVLVQENPNPHMTPEIAASWDQRFSKPSRDVSYRQYFCRYAKTHRNNTGTSFTPINYSDSSVRWHGTDESLANILVSDSSRVARLEEEKHVPLVQIHRSKAKQQLSHDIMNYRSSFLSRNCVHRTLRTGNTVTIHFDGRPRPPGHEKYRLETGGKPTTYRGMRL